MILSQITEKIKMCCVSKIEYEISKQKNDYIQESLTNVKAKSSNR